jgi:hypothetical protein
VARTTARVRVGLGFGGRFGRRTELGEGLEGAALLIGRQSSEDVAQGTAPDLVDLLDRLATGRE